MRISTLATLLVGVAILSGALLLAALPSELESDRPATDPTPRPVEIAPVAAPEGGVTLRFSGTVRAERRADLAFTVGGRLAERRVSLGDRVVAGQVLARLETDELGHAVAAAEAARDEAGARAAQAERERRRVERLAAARAATTEELEQATATAQALDAARSRADTALQEAARRLVETALEAPYPGTIVEVLAEPGEYLTPGRPVFRVAGDGATETEIRIPESLLPHLEAGAEVRVEGPTGPLAGRLTSVGHAAIGGGMLFPVVVTLEAENTPPPGTTVDVLLERRTPGAVAVPLAAVFDPGGGSPAVLVVRNDRARRVEVDVEALAGERVLVHGDLAVGEQVIVAGHGALIDGDPVEVAR